MNTSLTQVLRLTAEGRRLVDTNGRRWNTLRVPREAERAPKCSVCGHVITDAGYECGSLRVHIACVDIAS